MNTWSILTTYRAAFFHGLLITGELCAIVWASGLLIGTGAGALASNLPRTVGVVIRSSAFLVSSIPALILLVWAHYPAQALLGVIINPFATASVVLAIVNILAVAEIVRAALDVFPKGLVDAARVSGMTSREALRHIEIPLLLRHVAPSLLQQQVVMLHTTLFASLISVEEIFRAAQRINAEVYRPVEIYSALALFFVAICVPLNGLALILRRRLHRSDHPLGEQVS